MISMQSVCRDYHTGQTVVRALIDADLEVGAGEYLAVVGPSGSGKSTLMHLLGCLDTPTSGSFRLNGEEVSSFDVNRLAEVRNQTIGFVFQRFHLMPRSSALANVSMPMRFAGLPAGQRQERAMQLLHRVGLGDRVHHRPSELSGGQQQRVAIARALANDPRLVLADEPTGNLDSSSGQEVVRILEELQQEGVTVVMVTHDENLAARTSRVVRMLDGRICSDTASPTGC